MPGLEHGRVRWTTEVGTSLLAAPVVFRDDVYVGSADGVPLFESILAHVSV